MQMFSLFLTLTLGAQTWMHTDGLPRPRDYTTASSPITPVTPAVIEQLPWNVVRPGVRRRVASSDRLTIVQLELTGLSHEPLTTHSHPHDQITVVLEGRCLVQVGEEQREIGPGGCYVVPSNVVHGMRPLSERCVIMDTFTPARDDFQTPAR